MEVCNTLDKKSALAQRDDWDWIIFTHAVAKEDEANRERGRYRFTSSQHFAVVTLMHSWLRWHIFLTCRYFYNLHRGQLCQTIGLHQLLVKNGKIFVPESGRCLLRTGMDFPAECPHVDFSNTERIGSDFFFPANGQETADVWVSDSSHKFVHIIMNLNIC